jgi:hypothetical protein
MVCDAGMPLDGIQTMLETILVDLTTSGTRQSGKKWPKMADQPLYKKLGKTNSARGHPLQRVGVDLPTAAL